MIVWEGNIDLRDEKVNLVVAGAERFSPLSSAHLSALWPIKHLVFRIQSRGTFAA
jgi:hypothetical protein